MLDYVLFAESDRHGAFLGRARPEEARPAARRRAEREAPVREPPYGLTYEMIVENTYPRGTPTRVVIGSMKDLDAAVDDDVQEWFKDQLRPQQRDAGAGGRHHAGAARAKVEKYYGGIPPGPPLAKQGTWIASATPAPIAATLHDRVPQAPLPRLERAPVRHAGGGAARHRGAGLRAARPRACTTARLQGTRSPRRPPRATREPDRGSSTSR